MEIEPHSDPFAILDAWIQEAKREPSIKEPTAMTVATGVTGDLKARIVLCRGWTPEGLVFFTNYNSRKGQDLTHSPFAAAVFYWDALAKQVNVSGPVTKTSDEASDTYWRNRRRESQISQYISDQSQPVGSREELEKKWQEAERDFDGRPVPRPPHWGGYRIDPRKMEFWIGRTGRLHDRYLFEKTESGWTFLRLYP